MKKYVFESLKFFCAAILCTILSAFATPSHAALPSGYTQLEYIESTGTQWIDTGIMPTAKLKIESRVGIITDNASIFGSGTTSENRTQLYTYQQKINLRAWSSENKAIIPYTAGEVYIITVDFLNKKLTLNDTSVDFTYDVNSAINYPIYINEINLASSANRTAGKQAYYSFKMWENNTLVRDLIPAKRNSDGVIGMYDTVNNRFYTNAGTGEFIAGDPVTDNSCRNLFDGIVEQGTVINGDERTTVKTSHPIRVQAGKSYTFSMANNSGVTYNIATSDESAFNWTKYYYADNPTDWKNSTYTFAPTKDAYMAVSFRRSGAFTPNDFYALADSLKFQLEEGTTATEYVPYCSLPIKIATTKYNESAFSPLNTALANAISVVDSVVSNTITQAGRIATLQTQKQTRPNDIADDSEKCPAGKKCLLVTDTSGVPHWYEIVENAWDLPAGYTQLQYLRSDGRAYINTNYSPTSKTRIEVVAKVDSGAGNINIVGSGRGTTGDSGNALLVINSLDNNIAEIKFNSAGAWIRVDNVNMLEKNRLSLSATKFSVNGDVKETNNTTIPDTDNRPFYIFQRWRPSIASTNDKTQVYEFSIYENDILVRNFVPAKNASGVVGMYDTVEGRFYENAGEGSFVAGDPVSE